MRQINWDDLFKIRIANSDDSFQLHEVTKILIVMKLLNKYRTNKKWIRIYTEHKLNGITPDVYFENIKTKEVICYEIQKDLSKKWETRKIAQYKDYNIPYMNSIDLIIVPLEKLSENISKLNKQLDDYIF